MLELQRARVGTRLRGVVRISGLRSYVLQDADVAELAVVGVLQQATADLGVKHLAVVPDQASFIRRGRLLARERAPMVRGLAKLFVARIQNPSRVPKDHLLGEAERLQQPAVDAL